MKTSIGHFFVVLLFLTVFSLPFCFPSIAQAPDEMDFLAQVDIVLDKAQLRKAGLQTADVGNTLAQFYKDNPSFKLSDLHAMRITSASGEAFELKSMATIDVRLTSGKKK